MRNDRFPWEQLSKIECALLMFKSASPAERISEEERAFTWPFILLGGWEVIQAECHKSFSLDKN